MKEKMIPNLFPFKPAPEATYQPPAPIWSGEDSRIRRSDTLLLTETLEHAPEHHPDEAAILTKLTGTYTGRLKQSEDGHLFLKVDNQFITGLIHHFGNKASRPPYFHHIDRVGAHITVMSPKESVNVKEKGKEFTFRFTGCVALVPMQWPGVRKVWVLTVESEELEHLREKYRLSSTPSSRPFFLTVAIEKSQITKKPPMHHRVSPTATSV